MQRAWSVLARTGMLEGMGVARALDVVVLKAWQAEKLDSTW